MYFFLVNKNLQKWLDAHEELEYTIAITIWANNTTSQLWTIWTRRRIHHREYKNISKLTYTIKFLLWRKKKKKTLHPNSTEIKSYNSILQCWHFLSSLYLRNTSRRESVEKLLSSRPKLNVDDLLDEDLLTARRRAERAINEDAFFDSRGARIPKPAINSLALEDDIDEEVNLKQIIISNTYFRSTELLIPSTHTLIVRTRISAIEPQCGWETQRKQNLRAIKNAGTQQ